MNTFLPFTDFATSASCLDKRRCFKQVVEAYQLLNVLDGKSTGWKNHPALRMWVGHRDCLQYYYNIFYEYCEAIHKIKFVKLPKPILLPMYMDYPKWLGYEPFHLSMRQNLVRKAIDDMSKGIGELQFRLCENHISWDKYDIAYEYLWPVNKSGKLLPEIEEWYNGKGK
jgi:hypothetical protein